MWPERVTPELLDELHGIMPYDPDHLPLEIELIEAFFAGGIGENASLVRARICNGLEFLGIELNDARNADNAPIISMDARPVTVRVIRTDEEVMIARSVSRVLSLGAQKTVEH
jgi:hypothetical protein